MTDRKTFSRRFVLGGAAAMSAAAPAFSFMSAAEAQEAVMPPLSAYGKLPEVEDIALSPDGKRVAMVMTRKGERIIVDYELATQKAVAGAISADKIRHVMWADNNTIMVWTSATVKTAGELNEYSYASLLNLPANKRSVLYKGIPGGIVNSITGDFHRVKFKDGYRITASSYKSPEGINAKDGSSATALTETWERCLYAFSTSSSFGARIDSDSKPIEDWVIRPDASLVGRSEFDEDTKIWVLRYFEKGWKEIFRTEARYDKPWLAGLGRDANTLLVRYTGGENADVYVEFDSTGKQTPLDIDGAIHSPIFHPETQLLVGFENGGPVSDWTFYDPVMQRLPGLINKALADSFNDLLDMGENTRQIIVRSENAQDPGTYFFFDFSTGDFKEIGSAYPELTSVAPKSYITYKAADGLEIGAWLTLPKPDAKNLALVVLPHGGPEAMDDVRYDWMSQALASRGYAVLQPNYRGSSGYGKAFVEKGYGEFGRKMQTDLSDGVQHLAKQGTIDAKRVAIAGGSYGGYAALAGIALQKGLYRCAVSIAGISDPKAFLAYRRERTGYDGNSYSVEYWQRFVGATNQLDEISPLKHADAISVPVLLIHGKDDTVVPYNQSDALSDALKRAGKPVELITLKAEDHWLSREPTRVQTIEAMVDFIVKHNPPV